MTNESSAVLPETIADRLRASIISQADVPGSTVTEAAVALRFGVARPTARLAIDRLVADGLLRREAHRAARVPMLGRADILDLFENRAVLESAAIAALARGGVVPAAAMDAHRELMTQGDDFAQHDIAFHRALVAGQPSPRLTHLHGLLMGEIELCIGQVQAAHLIAGTEVARQHQGILDSIVAGDADAATGLVRRHIEGARDALIAHGERES